MKYGTPPVVRGRTQNSILRNVAILRERFPRQTARQDMAIALNIAADVSRVRAQTQPLRAR